jgi:hypothetical protein
MRSCLSVFLFALATLPPTFASKRACIQPEDALKHINKDICVTAHVYRVVDAAEGIHFLDVCSPETSDADCHFFILSPSRDEKSIAYLKSLSGKNIQIRGTVHTIQGHAEMVLSSERQLHDGKEPFHPNPQLLKKFSAANGGKGFSTRNGVMGQRGVRFSH